MERSEHPRPRACRFKASRAVCGSVRVHATLHGFPEKERALDLPPGALADDVPRALGIRPEIVLVFRDERPLPGDAPLGDGDKVRVLRIVSGGRARAAPASGPLLKGLLLGASLLWLAAYGVTVGDAGSRTETTFYFGGLAFLAVLGGAGYARRPFRHAAAVVAGLFAFVVAVISFSHLLILAGMLGVLVSITLPPAAPTVERKHS